MRQLNSSLLLHSFLFLAISLTSISKSRAADGVPNVINLPQAPPLLERKEVAPAPTGATVYSKVVSSVILIRCKKSEGVGLGTGSIISTSGLVLTNVHVIKGATACFGTLKPPGFNSLNSETPLYPLKLIALDPTKDLALVQFQTSIPGLKPLPIGQMSNIQIGQEVHAIGHPLGNFWTYTKGVISQVRLQEKGIPPLVADTIQTQTPISPGNSGGPLLDNDGYLIGVNTWVRTDAQNINFAVAVSEVRAFIARANKGENRPPQIQGNSGSPSQGNSGSPNPGNSGSPNPGNSGSPSQGNSGSPNPGNSCKTRVIREEASQKTPGKVLRLDLGCTGKENAAMLIPNDPSRERILYISTKLPAGGEKLYFDIRYYIDQKTGKFLRSWYDVDRDGRPDYVGIHKTGSIEPTSYFFFNALSAE
jgi:S1-C subfamily serine protease